MNGGRQGGHHCGCPPVTALDRFLIGRTQTHQHNLSQNHEIKPSISWNLLSESACLPVDHDNRDVDTNTMGECLSLEEIRNYPCYDRNQESNRVIVPAPVSRSRKFKGSSISKILIKGQWSVEEDRKLIRLVNEYGEQKWAFIAEKMIGRLGKQCRERWRNHLRPDIKKDAWSEEEVKLLITAHQKLGNKWAEIAKQIPGRTENSIKNQWNATKRRQNSKRINKKGDAKYINPQLTLLQDYIKSTCNKSNNSNPSISTTSSTTTTTTTGATTENCSNIFPDQTVYNNNDPDISLEITQSYEDELNFMQTFFKTSSATTDAGVTAARVVDSCSLCEKCNWIWCNHCCQ